ncbi:Mitochondrial oxaloacetate transport protein [Alternaria alternata]|nr:Mitochondrial oxaloacetate transport protein [Alternaria alternata]
MTFTPWKTPLYNRGASVFALSSPCSCKLGDRQRIGCAGVSRGKAHRILTVSKPWVTVTAPHAAMPPAMKELFGRH